MILKNANEYILIIEDSKADYLKLEMAIQEAQIGLPLVHFDNGDEALDFLIREGHYKDREDINPALTFLDINLPGEDGFEILRQVRASKSLRKMPVVVLTTSTDQGQIDRCYEFGANSFIAKPQETDGFFKAITLVKEYWFHLVNLPRSSSKG